MITVYSVIGISIGGYFINVRLQIHESEAKTVE